LKALLRGHGWPALALWLLVFAAVFWLSDWAVLAPDRELVRHAVATTGTLVCVPDDDRCIWEKPFVYRFVVAGREYRAIVSDSSTKSTVSSRPAPIRRRLTYDSMNPDRAVTGSPAAALWEATVETNLAAAVFATAIALWYLWAMVLRDR
jgi:hypothetical protein